jgi:uncharacterized phage protein (TIGR02218 family)
MKLASPGLIALLASTKDLIMTDLWTFSLVNGTVLRYTTWDQDLTVAANTFKSHDVILASGKITQTRGLEVNETDLTCYPNLTTSPSKIGNIPFLQALRSGLLDNATAQRERIFMPTPGDVSLGTVRIFLGLVTEVDITRNVATVKCKDITYLLNIYMPRRQYMPTCAWTFGDSNCTIDKAALAATSAIGTGSTPTNIVCSLTQASGFFNFGTVTMTGGLNSGVSRAVKNFSPHSVTLTGPFPQPLAVGDTFSIVPGCSKNLNAPTQQFNGAAADGNSPMFIQNNIGSAAGAYNGMNMTFTSGALNGQTQPIAQWQPTAASMQFSFSAKPAVGDSFNIVTPSGVVSGVVETTLSPQVIPLGLTNANGFFNGGMLQFTSGVCVGETRTISSWANGVATLANNLGSTPSPGDECTLTTVGTNNNATCTGYNNVINFGGESFIPIPETAY